MIEFFYRFFSDWVSTFLDPSKRVFVGYLACALLIALVYRVRVHKQGLMKTVKGLLSKKVWLSVSAKIDYKMIVINQLLLAILSPLLLSQLAVATFLFFYLHEWFAVRPQWFASWSAVSVNLVFTFCYFLFDDFMRFYVHRLMHRWPVLWAFHKVHHSAEYLTPMTVLRSHPVETLIFSLRAALVQGISIAAFVFFFGDAADLFTVYGAIVFSFIFNILGSNLRHSHVALAYWKPIEKWFISPAQHQIHHSKAKAHWDKNFGVALSVWDRLWGSLCYSEKNQRLRFGVEGVKHHSLYAVYIEPVIEGAVIIGSAMMRVLYRLRELIYRYFRVVILWKY